MRVKNLGRLAISEKGSSWLAYWERFSAQNAFMCFAAGCINTPSIGALVQKEGAADGKWYVIPLCGQCGKRNAPELEIWDMAPLVSAGEGLEPAEAGRGKFVRWPPEWIPRAAHGGA